MAGRPLQGVTAAARVAEQGWPLVSVSPPSSEVDPQCSGGQWVEKMGFISQVGHPGGGSWHQSELTQFLCHIPTSRGCGCCRKACPVMPPREPPVPSYFPRSDQWCRLH